MQLHSVLPYLYGGGAIYQLAKLKSILFLACDNFNRKVIQIVTIFVEHITIIYYCKKLN